MDTFLQMQQAVQSDLTVGSESSLFPLTTIQSAIMRAYRKIGGMYRWPETEDAKKTSTVSNQEYYDYPQTWQPDSVWKLEVDGVDLKDPTLYKDYIYETENNFPGGEQSIWTSQWRRFFIRPIPTTNGNNNISIWGQKAVDAMTQDGDTTIFSYAMPECNEAILLEAAAILRTKGGEEPVVLRRYIGGSLLLSIEAKQIIDGAWMKIKQNQQKYEGTQPFFDVPNFFPVGRNRNGIRNKIGDF